MGWDGFGLDWVKQGSATLNSVVHCSWFKQLLQALQNWQLRLPQSAKRKKREEDEEEDLPKLKSPEHIVDILYMLAFYLLLSQAMLLLPTIAST